ncbi:alpha/beta fold hydrolase [Streptomyces sp. NPDC001858]
MSRLALITANPWALGRTATPEERLEAARLRADEPWFAAAFPAFEAWLAGGGEPDWTAVAPFFHGRWDATARAHDAAADEQTNAEAEGVFLHPDAFDPPALRSALAEVAAPVLVLAGGADGGPRPEAARLVADAFPHAELAVQPGAGHYPWLDDPEWFVRRLVAFLGADQPFSASATSRAHR